MTDTSGLSRADATRARLLDAAITTFAEKGFHGTTTRDIAAAAGISPGALYVHHKSKEELLYLISRAGHENTLQLVREATRSSSEPTDALRKVIYDFAINHARRHTRARIVNYELAALTPVHYAEIRNIRRDIEQEIHGLVDRGVDTGDFDVLDPLVTGVALLSLGIDIARWYRDEGSWSPEDIADQYTKIALRIVGAQGATLGAQPSGIRSQTP